MIDRNTSMDYAKLNNLIKLDQLDGNRKGVLLEIAEKGSITGKVANSFPAAQLTDPEMFKSLLFYYGMLTFTDDYGTASSRNWAFPITMSASNITSFCCVNTKTCVPLTCPA